MLPSLDSYRPESPTGRAAAAAGFGVVGLVALFVLAAHLFAIQFRILESSAVLFTAATAVLFTALAYNEATAVVDRAEAVTSRSEATDVQQSSRPDEDPVTTLQNRYADGELSTEEFERRLDELVESDAQRTATEDTGNVATRADDDLLTE